MDSPEWFVESLFLPDPSLAKQPLQPLHVNQPIPANQSPLTNQSPQVIQSCWQTNTRAAPANDAVARNQRHHNRNKAIRSIKSKRKNDGALSSDTSKRACLPAESTNSRVQEDEIRFVHTLSVISTHTHPVIFHSHTHILSLPLTFTLVYVRFCQMSRHFFAHCFHAQAKVIEDEMSTQDELHLVPTSSSSPSTPRAQKTQSTMECLANDIRDDPEGVWFNGILALVFVTEVRSVKEVNAPCDNQIQNATPGVGTILRQLSLKKGDNELIECSVFALLAREYSPLIVSHKCAMKFCKDGKNESKIDQHAEVLDRQLQRTIGLDFTCKQTKTRLIPSLRKTTLQIGKLIGQQAYHSLTNAADTRSPKHTKIAEMATDCNFKLCTHKHSEYFYVLYAYTGLAYIKSLLKSKKTKATIPWKEIMSLIMTFLLVVTDFGNESISWLVDMDDESKNYMMVFPMAAQGTKTKRRLLPLSSKDGRDAIMRETKHTLGILYSILGGDDNEPFQECLPYMLCILYLSSQAVEGEVGERWMALYTKCCANPPDVTKVAWQYMKTKLNETKEKRTCTHVETPPSPMDELSTFPRVPYETSRDHNVKANEAWSPHEITYVICRVP